MATRQGKAKVSTAAGPPRRPATLQINRLDDGCVVYQPDRERVHFLNRTAAAILYRCDGRREFREIESWVKKNLPARGDGRNMTGGVLRRFMAEGLVIPSSREKRVSG